MFSLSSSPLVPTLFLLLLSLPFLFLYGPRLLPPRPITISLPDELDDLSLLRRASAAASATSSPLPSAKSRLGSTNPSPKIAFLFLTNSPLTFSPLWQIFFANASSNLLYNIYVHADPSIPIPKDSPPFTPNHFIPSKRTERSSPTLVAAARRLLATALLDDRRNAFFALVSQHCVPLHSFAYVRKTLFEHRSILDLTHRSFIEILSHTSFMSNRYNARGEHVMLPEVPFDRFKMGSQFFILTRRHAVAVVRDRRLWRKFRLPCVRDRESCYPEEHYFPTLLSMEDPEGCAGYTLTRVNWTGMVEGHPHTYRPREVSPELIYKLRESNFSQDYLFARKFSPECLEPLLKISDSVIFRD